MKRYSNIQIISSENGDLGAAGNTGILEAKGEYLLLLDSDDTIGTDTL